MSKKIRNRLLALLLLLAFVGFGLLYYVNWVVQKPFAVILFVVDNFAPSTLTAARLYGGGAENRLALERFPNLAVLSNPSADFAVSDVAAASTALATGRKTNNRSLGQDPQGAALETLASLAQSRGRAVGLVTNCAVTDPGLAAYYARTNEPGDGMAMALQLASGKGFDVVLGGGAADFLPEHKGGRRTDGRDVLMELRQAGYDLARTPAELANTPLWRAPRLLGIFGESNLAFADEVAVAAGQPTLAEMVAQAIRLLQFNRKGYLLVVDAGLVGKAAARNEGERTMREFLQVDAAVATALAYAGENSLVVVAGRSSVGGLRLNGFPFRNDKGIGLLGVNAQGLPAVTWSTGPGSRPDAASQTLPEQEPAAFRYPAGVPVAEDVLAVGVGPGAEAVSGFLDNTDIFPTLDKSL